MRRRIMKRTHKMKILEEGVTKAKVLPLDFIGVFAGCPARLGKDGFHGFTSNPRTSAEAAIP